MGSSALLVAGIEVLAIWHNIVNIIWHINVAREVHVEPVGI